MADTREMQVTIKKFSKVRETRGGPLKGKPERGYLCDCPDGEERWIGIPGEDPLAKGSITLEIDVNGEYYNCYKRPGNAPVAASHAPPATPEDAGLTVRSMAGIVKYVNQIAIEAAGELVEKRKVEGDIAISNYASAVFEHVFVAMIHSDGLFVRAALAMYASRHKPKEAPKEAPKEELHDDRDQGDVDYDDSQIPF